MDSYMQMRKDGHIKFYTEKEWQDIAIRFPKKKQTASEPDDSWARFDKLVITGYALEIKDDEIWITERVNNITYQKERSFEGITDC